jgi:hypothetical protein
MNASLSRAVSASGLRTLFGLVLAAALLPWALGPTPPARAQGPIIRDHRDPSARFQLVINRIIVHDDMDWGKGEISISARVRTNGERCMLYTKVECGRMLAETTVPQFSATDNQSVLIDRLVPAAGDSTADTSVGPEIGIPFQPGQWYGLVFRGYEIDPAADDSLGVLSTHITGEDGQIQYGTRTERGFNRCESTPILPDFCPNGVSGAFSVEYEIRPAPLPDLHPTAFRVADEGPGDRDELVCFTVQNQGPTPSVPFRVTIGIEGALPPVKDIGASELAAGETREQCTGLRLPDSGSHQLSLIADSGDAVVETNERNNGYEQIVVRAPVASPGPVVGTGTASADSGTGSEPVPPVINVAPDTSTPPATKPSPEPVANQTSGQADLTVSAIRVRGQVPDGKDDCKDGKNDVAVVVKNGGLGQAGSFVVRLTVDGDEAAEQSVNGLDAGQEREVRFDGVRLKKGEHKLAATLDPKNTVVESKEDNNQRQVTARCQDGD